MTPEQITIRILLDILAERGGISQQDRDSLSRVLDARDQPQPYLPVPSDDAVKVREAALKEAAAVAHALKGMGWDESPAVHPYDRGYLKACDIISQRILALLTKEPRK